MNSGSHNASLSGSGQIGNFIQRPADQPVNASAAAIVDQIGHGMQSWSGFRFAAMEWSARIRLSSVWVLVPFALFRIASQLRLAPGFSRPCRVREEPGSKWD